MPPVESMWTPSGSTSPEATYSIAWVEQQSVSALTSAEVLTYMTTMAPGCWAFQERSWAASIDSESEQPAPRSAIRTVFSGERIEAVSAMKWTPQNSITEASVAAAWRERPSESPK